MKKSNIFFMKLLIVIILIGFSGTSSAYDLSKWTSKPVEWARHVAQWFGYGDKDENKPAAAPTGVTKAVNVQPLKEESPQKDNSYAVLTTRETSSQIEAGLYDIKDTFSLSNETPDYSIRFRGPVKNTRIDIYGWHEESVNPLDITDNNFDQLTVSAFEQYLNGYDTRSSNVAARFSYNLPFLGILHQGMAPSLYIESSYRFKSSRPSYPESGLHEATDYRWNTGVSYIGKNLVNLPVSPVGINWGIGYDYKVASDNYNTLENSYETHNYHSGSIFAGSYWYNLKLYTMFMYLYDSESSGGITILNATYSPSLRWTYGIRANFYNGKKEVNGKGIISNPELVSFTATYRWD